MATDKTSTPTGHRLTAVKYRLALLPRIMELPNQAAVADALGIGYSGWMNIVGGENLSSRVATLLVRNVPGLTRDWLYDGTEDGLSVQMLRRIRTAERKGKW
jgi:hypothetical protein